MVRKLAALLDEVQEPRLAARLLPQLQGFYAAVTESRRSLFGEAVPPGGGQGGAC